MDKAFGLGRLITLNGLAKSDILFFGDKLGVSGNDHPVKEMGIDCIAAAGPDETAVAVHAIVQVS